MGAKDTDNPRPALESHSTSTESILSEAKNTNFADPQKWKPFQDKHYTRLTNSYASLSNSKRAADQGRKGKKKEREVLEQILNDREDRPLAQYQPFVRWVIKHHRQLLTLVGKSKPTPLAQAIQEEQHEFVSLVLQHVDNIEDLLSFKISSNNCLQCAIEFGSPFAEAMITKLHGELSRVKMAKTVQSDPTNGTSSKENLFLAKGENGMTALHIAAEDIQTNPDESFRFKNWDETAGKYEEDSQPGTKAHAGGTDTPRTQPNVKRDMGRPAPEKEVKMVKIFPGAQGPRVPTDDEFVRDAGRPAGQGAAAQQQPAPAPTDGKTSAEYRFNRLSVIRALIKAEPKALRRKNNEDNTPFQARLQALAKDKDIDVEDSDEERRKLFEEDEILTYMRQYIIENFSRKEALEALYKEGNARHGPVRPQVASIARTLTFDLFGLPYPSIDADFLEGLGKVLRFEGLLKYVNLPRVAFRNCKGLRCDEHKVNTEYANDTNQKPNQNPNDEGIGRQDMCDVFQWLRDCGVSSIMTVRVIDYGDVGHSDEAIEKCMKGFGVRSWNWYRLDLPCDVILTSAKEVKDVALCSSGNNAVLAGWASPSGLVKLAKLKTVDVIIQKGLERRSRLEKYADEFKKKITDQRPDVKVTYTIKADLTVDSFFTDRNANDSAESTWMRTMVDFGKYLAEANRDLNIAPVKIAIIDDGINPTLNIFNDRVKRGESFHQLSENYNGRRGSFYVPSGPHGTLMAQLVCKVCPMVQLYIAQLEVFRGQQGQRSFRAESAADAVTWAVNQGVDIISMSWYIKEDERGLLDEALQLAAGRKIIMFCSSIDEGATDTNTTYPGKIVNCIKIGASTDTGARLSWVSSDCHFLLPGDARHGRVRDGMFRGSQKSESISSDSWSQGTMERHGHFGSSVSTALAAGLAGTLLFSERLGRLKFYDRLRHKFDRPGQDKDNLLRDSSHMRRALTSLSTDKFIHWNKFPEMGSEPWVWDRDPKKYGSMLADFVSLIIT